MNASRIPCAVIGSLLYPASPTRAQPGPNGLRKKLGTDPPWNRSSRSAATNPPGELGRKLQGLEVVRLGIGLVRRGLRVRPADDEHRQTVVRRDGGPTSVGPDEDLEAIDRQPAPVRVVAPLQHRLFVVLLRHDGLRDVRVATVRTDHNARPFDDRHTILAVTANSDDCTILDEDLVQGEAFTNFGTGPRGSVDEDLVEHRRRGA